MRQRSGKHERDRVIEEVPMFGMNARDAGKNLAKSELRKRFRDWLQSEDGQAWKQDREALFGKVKEDDLDGDFADYRDDNNDAADDVGGAGTAGHN